MPYYHFQWTPEAIEHLEEHDINPEDFERVVSRPKVTGRSRSSNLPAAYGYAKDGRYIIAIYKFIDEISVEPITSYEIDE